MVAVPGFGMVNEFLLERVEPDIIFQFLIITTVESIQI